MRILYINAVYEYGSTGRSIKELENFGVNNGHEIYVASCRLKKSDRHYNIGDVIDYKIHALFSRISGKQAHFSKISTYRLITWIDKVKPDVIQINNAHSNYLDFYYLIKQIKKRKIPVSLVLDDCWFYTGHCCHYTSVNCQLWKKECDNCPQLYKWNVSYFFDQSGRNLREKRDLYEYDKLGVIGVSDWICKEAKESILSGAKIQRIYNWIDIDVFKPVHVTNKIEELENKKIILGVANYWDDSKGLKYFKQLAELLGEEYRVLLIGDWNFKDDNHEIYHVRRTEDIETLVQYYNMADVFVQFSLEESFGKVCAEALACGTPLVVFDSTASPELVGPECGFVVPKSDVEQAALCIKKICALPKKQYQTVCRKFAESNFSGKKNMQSYFDFYCELKEE